MSFGNLRKWDKEVFFWSMPSMIMHICLSSDCSCIWWMFYFVTGLNTLEYLSCRCKNTDFIYVTCSSSFLNFGSSVNFIGVVHTFLKGLCNQVRVTRTSLFVSTVGLLPHCARGMHHAVCLTHHLGIGRGLHQGEDGPLLISTIIGQGLLGLQGVQIP